MVSEYSFDSRFSIMSLSVAKDSGWYDVNLGLAEQYFWGKDEGCDIFEADCSKVSEFCSISGKSGCSDNHVYTTTCHKSELAPECHINMNIVNCKKQHFSNIPSFSFGQDSVCLVMSVQTYVKLIKRFFLSQYQHMGVSKSNVLMTRRVTLF